MPKIKCSKCDVAKDASKSRFEKLTASKSISTYKCRGCRKDSKVKSKEVKKDGK